MGKPKQRLKQLGLTFQERLLKKYFVRWHMSAILGAAIASGLLLDKLFLLLGLGSMGWRYALSVLGAYGVFFVLVRMWIWYAAGVAVQVGLGDFTSSKSRSSSGGSSALDIPDFGGAGTGAQAEFAGFGGGDSGGGGASDLFDAPVISSSGGGGGGGGGFDIDLDDGFWIVLLLAILVAVICGAGAYLVWMAPEILPEVALECAIGAGLVKQLKNPESGWAGRLLWKTWIPLTIITVSAYFAGMFIQMTCPSATHVRAALHCAVTQ
ncbi:MAG: hypothetical protein HYX27_00920 [Acidobacteria bacterium]|nr:hypothetical protein [Acidobacteriota bacterium]